VWEDVPPPADALSPAARNAAPMATAAKNRQARENVNSFAIGQFTAISLSVRRVNLCLLRHPAL
jgi:hypothetical protein